MTREEHLMVIAMEECDETSQRISKALRFGMAEVQPDWFNNPDALTNAERIRREFSDLAATLEMLGIGAPLGKWMDEKRAKVEKFLKYSEQCGTLVGSHGTQSLSEASGSAQSEALKSNHSSNSGVSSTAQHVERIEGLRANVIAEFDDPCADALAHLDALISAVQAQAREEIAALTRERDALKENFAVTLQANDRFHRHNVELIERAEAAEARLALMETPQE